MSIRLVFRIKFEIATFFFVACFMLDLLACFINVLKLIKLKIH